MINVCLFDLTLKDAPETDVAETDVHETDGADGWRRDGRCALSTLCMVLVTV